MTVKEVTALTTAPVIVEVLDFETDKLEKLFPRHSLYTTATDLSAPVLDISYYVDDVPYIVIVADAILYNNTLFVPVREEAIS